MSSLEVVVSQRTLVCQMPSYAGFPMIACWCLISWTRELSEAEVKRSMLQYPSHIEEGEPGRAFSSAFPLTSGKRRQMKVRRRPQRIGCSGSLRSSQETSKTS